VTIDLFFDDPERFNRYHRHPAIQAEAIARLYETPAHLVSIYPVETLHMVKISFPRASPQGGVVERDLHSGQLYVDLLNIELD
jgi:hypothetical protein